MNKIHNKILITDNTYRAVINEKGQIVSDVTMHNFAQMTKLDDNHILNSLDYTILDDKLNPIFRIPASNTIVYSDKVIVFQINNLYGAIDYTGKVVIPFKYTYLSLNFYDGKTYGVNEYDEINLISLNNTKSKLDGNIKYITAGLLFAYDDELDPTTQLYGCKIINYSNETKLSLDLQNTIYNTYNIENPFGSHKILKLAGKTESIYVSIKLN